MKADIIILGDICPRWEKSELFDSYDAREVFHDILPMLQTADYVTCNLECPVTVSIEKIVKTSMNLKTEPKDVHLLKCAGIDAVSLANNHILDYGQRGIVDTFAALQKENLTFYGAGSEEKAGLPVIIDIANKKVAFMAFAEHEFNCASDYEIGANQWDDIESLRQIQEVKAQADFLIIQYHGGIEDYQYPSPVLQKKCRAMVDAGADFVTCQHSHCIGSMEKWNDGEILYGQGNTVFGYSEKSGTLWNEGLICQFEIDGDQSKVSYIPIVARKDGIYLADSEEKDRILNALKQRSDYLGEQEFVRQKWCEFCDKQAPSYLPMLSGWSVNMIRLNKLSKGRLYNWIVGKNQKRNSMNLIRCDAHREVVTTIMTENYKKDSLSRREGSGG